MNRWVWIWLLTACGVHGAPDGAPIYREQCASCHGAQGEGVADKYDEPLYGRRSLEALGRYIEKWMPEEEPEKCVGEDARAVAAYIHGAFYSPEARAKGQRQRVELARLTNEQFRQSVADLVGSFTGRPPRFEGGGLKGEYFNAEQMNLRKQHLLDRTDAGVAFAHGDFAAVPQLDAQSFSVTWTGSLFAPDTGDYGFRLVTANGARLFLNAPPGGKDGQERPFIDGWVSRGDEPRTEEGRLFLLGGRVYPLRLQFLCYRQPSAGLRFEWKPPHGEWEVVPGEVLSAAWAPAVAVVATPFPPDDGSQGYERGTAVSREWHAAVVRAAVETSRLVAAHADRLAKTAPDQPDRVAKLRAFCEAFAARAFRRPLDDALRESFVGKSFAAGEPDDAVRTCVVRVLCSPRFLYPGLGGPADDHARAARLALALWDSLPDEALAAAASTGQLGQPDQLDAQARRMVDDPRARHKLRGFFHHWLAMDEADKLAKDRAVYPGFDERLVADLRRSLERFVDDVMWSGASDYRQLLLASDLFVNRRLAEFYGIEPPAGEGFAKVAQPPERRAGVFTHPYLLAAFSYHKSSSPIHRGVFVTRNLLGRFLKPPPMAIEFMDDRFDPALTMREKVTQLTGKPACMSCHVVINPLGFSLENFDAAGRWRETESGKPVDPVSDYETSGGQVIRLGGPRDLAEHAAASREAGEGFVRQLFQHLAKQSPAAYGPDRLGELHGGFAASNFHVRDLVLRIAVTAAMFQPEPATAAR